MGSDQFNLNTFAGICLAWKAFCEAVSVASVDAETKEKWTKDMYEKLFEPSTVAVP